MPTDNEDFFANILKKVSKIEKEMGNITLIRLSDETKFSNISVVSTGSLMLNKALGVWGLPFGRLVEIVGEPMIGKSLLALSVVAEAQQMSEPIAIGFVDAENAIDKTLLENYGIDLTRLWISQIDSGEDGLALAEKLIQEGFRLIVIDSVASLIPKRELEGDMAKEDIALQARMMSKALRRLQAVASTGNAIIIFVNQLREAIGVMYGERSVSPGGRALKFYASVRLDIKKVSYIKSGNDIIGHRVKVKVAKNKVAVPFKEAEFDIIYGKGIDKLGELLECGVATKVINRAGTWYSYKDERIGQGKEAAKSYLSVMDKAEFKKLKDEIIEKFMSVEEEIKPVTDDEINLEL